MKRSLWLLGAAFLSTACTTVPKTPGAATPVATLPPGPVVIAAPLPAPPPAPIIQTPRTAPSEPPPEPVIQTPTPSGFAALQYWNTHDSRPGLFAFARGCESWAKADPDEFLNANLPEYGRYGDWSTACQGASVLASVNPSAADSRSFFEAWFRPVTVTTANSAEGLLTGYYEPEVDVRLAPDAVFSEPVLAKPASDKIRKLPRSEINARTSRVIAYGRPIDVFFLQVQGSGRLKYGDGRILRAGYAGNNGHPYESIGGVLIRRGELTREQSSKQSISEWMERNGPAAARDLMNENPRYIYFAEQTIRPGEGPQGAMRVPLTGLGAIAVDPRYHPYGSLAWLETTLPSAPGDYRGTPTGLLVAAQDTGSAIKGPLRADLFFGSGYDAGERAGVQKHPVRWTLILPRYMSGTTIS